MSAQYRTFNSYQVRSAIMARTNKLRDIKSPVIIGPNNTKTTVSRDDYIDTLLYKIRTSKIIYFATIEAPTDVEINKKVIGSGGYYFYKTTIEKKILFMWHNRAQGVYEFWSQTVEGLEKAMEAMEKRKLLCANEQVVEVNINDVLSESKTNDDTEQKNSQEIPEQSPKDDFPELGTPPRKDKIIEIPNAPKKSRYVRKAVKGVQLDFN